MSALFWIVVLPILTFGFVVFFGAPYVPSRRKHLKQAFDELYAFSNKDVLLDLGSGDGVVLREVSSRGASAVGFELNPVLVLIANIISMKDKNVTSQIANMWRTPFPSGTTVVYMFGDSRDIDKLFMRVQQESTRLKRSLMVVSYGFQPKEFQPIKQTATHYLYKVKPLLQKGSNV